MGRIIETPRERRSPRFYHPRKTYKLTPLPPEERLTTAPGRATPRRIHSKLTGDSARLREVSRWIYLGFEPATRRQELSTVFTVGAGGEGFLIIASVLRHRTLALKRQTKTRGRRRVNSGGFSKGRV